MAHYLNPKNDLTFKKIFGEHKDICISLLNSMMPFEEDRKIVDITYNVSELTPQIETLKNSIVDVRCTDNFNRQFIVEMQMYWTNSFQQRVLFNASKAYVKQLKKGDDIHLLQPVYSLNFVNDIYEKSPEMRDVYYHHYQIVNIANTGDRIEGLEFVFIELPKFSPVNRTDRKLHNLWLRFLTEIKKGDETVPAELLQEKEICEAVELLEESAYTTAELEAYDRFLDIIRTQVLVKYDAEKKGRSEGLAEGIEKGIAEGMEEGLAKGLAKGRAEGIERMKQTVINLYGQNIPVEIIASCTKLSVEEVKRITGT
jgi:predicted transposase/invertase (TIGR01784 family)